MDRLNPPSLTAALNEGDMWTRSIHDDLADRRLASVSSLSPGTFRPPRLLTLLPRNQENTQPSEEKRATVVAGRELDARIDEEIARAKGATEEWERRKASFDPSLLRPTSPRGSSWGASFSHDVRWVMPTPCNGIAIRGPKGLYDYLEYDNADLLSPGVSTDQK